jgi:hypothetical protein
MKSAGQCAPHSQQNKNKSKTIEEHFTNLGNQLTEKQAKNCFKQRDMEREKTQANYTVYQKYIERREEGGMGGCRVVYGLNYVFS